MIDLLKKSTKGPNPTGGRPGGPRGRPGWPGGPGGQRFQCGQKFQSVNRPAGGNFRRVNAGLQNQFKKDDNLPKLCIFWFIIRSSWSNFL